ncbi:MAG TPA: hypothetical protein VEC96_03765, partial [Anaerolineae bacterium]|nr:hypothetical protein [Anaerolineae bacterium]
MKRTRDLRPPTYWKEAGLAWRRPPRSPFERSLTTVFSLFSIAAILGGSLILIGAMIYAWLAAQLPSAAELRS